MEVASGGTGAVGAVGPESPSGAEPLGGEASPSATPATAGAALAPVVFVPWWEGNGGAADVAVGAEPRLPHKAPLLPAGPGARVPDALAAALPLAHGLLAEGVALGAGAAERAVNALTEPLLAAEGESGAFLYWVGFSSWVVAAALACEGARRSWRRRTALAAAAGLPPEGDL
jgi:hypothetical protein